MPKCDYAGYVNRIREIERLVIPAENINWLKRYSKPDRPVDYHSCRREWSDLDIPGLAVRNYISLVSQSLGISEPDRYQQYRCRRDIDATVASARAAWQSHGLTEQKARDLAHKHFTAPRYPPKGSVDTG